MKKWTKEEVAEAIQLLLEYAGQVDTEWYFSTDHPGTLASEAIFNGEVPNLKDEDGLLGIQFSALEAAALLREGWRPVSRPRTAHLCTGQDPKEFWCGAREDVDYVVYCLDECYCRTCLRGVVGYGRDAQDRLEVLGLEVTP